MYDLRAVVTAVFWNMFSERFPLSNRKGALLGRPGRWLTDAEDRPKNVSAQEVNEVVVENRLEGLSQAVLGAPKESLVGQSFPCSSSSGPGLPRPRFLI